MDRHGDRPSHLHGHSRGLSKVQRVLVPHSDDDDDDYCDDHLLSHEPGSPRSRSSKLMRTSVGGRHASWMNAGNRMELLSASIQGRVLVSPWRRTSRQRKPRTQAQTQTQTQTQVQTQTQTEQQEQRKGSPLVHSDIHQGCSSQTSKEDISNVANKEESVDLPHKFGRRKGRHEIESIQQNQLPIVSNSSIVCKHSSPSASWHHQQSDDLPDSTPVQEPPMFSQSFLIATSTSSGAIIASGSAIASAASSSPSSTPLGLEKSEGGDQVSLKSKERSFQRSSSTPNLSSSSLTSEPMRKKNSKRKRRRSQSATSSPSISSSMLVTENLSDITRYLENDLSGTRPSF